jgi:hypothetical protein
MGARGKGNGGGYPALAMDGREGACSDGDCEGDPMLAIDTRHVDNKNGDVRGGSVPALGKETLYGTDTAAGAAADDVKCCHKQGCNKRQRPRHRAELRRDEG